MTRKQQLNVWLHVWIRTKIRHRKAKRIKTSVTATLPTTPARCHLLPRVLCGGVGPVLLARLRAAAAAPAPAAPLGLVSGGGRWAASQTPRERSFSWALGDYLASIFFKKWKTSKTQLN